MSDPYFKIQGALNDLMQGCPIDQIPGLVRAIKVVAAIESEEYTRMADDMEREKAKDDSDIPY